MQKAEDNNYNGETSGPRLMGREHTTLRLVLAQQFDKTLESMYSSEKTMILAAFIRDRAMFDARRQKTLDELAKARKEIGELQAIVVSDEGRAGVAVLAKGLEEWAPIHEKVTVLLLQFLEATAERFAPIFKLGCCHLGLLGHRQHHVFVEDQPVTHPVADVREHREPRHRKGPRQKLRLRVPLARLLPKLHARRLQCFLSILPIRQLRMAKRFQRRLMPGQRSDESR